MNTSPVVSRSNHFVFWSLIIIAALVATAAQAAPTRDSAANQSASALAGTAPTIISITPAIGRISGGSLVTITGTNLTGVTAVTFDATAAVIGASSSNYVDVTVPAHAAGSVDVVVTTAAGSAVASEAFRYVGRTTSGCFDLTRGVDLQVGSTTRSIAVGRLNGDNFSDLVAVSSDSNVVSVLLGRGNGTFAPAVNYGVGSRPEAVVIADFNHDRNQDLAVANASSDSVSVLIGRGDGSFAAAVNYGSGYWSPSYIASGDFDGDGNLDLATVGYNLSIFPGKGDGTFGAPRGYSISRDAGGVAVGDFNRDGKQDLVIGTEYQSHIVVYLGNGDFTFTTQPSIVTGNWPRALAVGDFNGDRVQDLAVGNDLNGAVSILLGTGNGSFTIFGNYSASWSASAIAVTDVNGDGIQDLAVAGGRKVVLVGAGGGRFNVNSYDVGSRPEGVAAGDFNGDGVEDLAFAETMPNDQVSIFLTSCIAITSMWPKAGLPSGGESVTIRGRNLSGATSVTFGGTPGLISSNTSTEIYVTTPAHPTGTVDVVVTTPLGSVTAYDRFTFDNPPVVADQTFAVEETAPAGSIVGNLAFSDPDPGQTLTFQIGFPLAIDSAGVISLSSKLDYEKTHQYLPTVTVSDGVFPKTATVSLNVIDIVNEPPAAVRAVPSTGLTTGGETVQITGAELGAVTAVRFGGSDAVIGTRTSSLITVVAPPHRAGVVDIAVTNAGGTSILAGAYSYLSASACLDLTGGGSRAAGTTVTGLASADFNRDGWQDLVVGGADKVAVLINDGHGGFKPPKTYAMRPTVMAVSVADFNADGFADIAILTSDWPSGGYVSVLLNSGGDTFVPGLSHHLSGWVSSMVTGDFNGDRRPEIAAISDCSLWILPGSGPGNPEANAEFWLSTCEYAMPSRPVVADLKHDGHLDLLIGSEVFIEVVLGTESGFASGGLLWADSPDILASGDFNGDRHEDIAVASSAYGGLVVFLGQEGGTFAEGPRYALEYPTSMAAGDFNGDGKQDLAVASQSLNRVSILRGNGDGTFMAATSLSAPAPTQLAVCDVNGDGHHDIVTGNYASTSVSTIVSNCFSLIGIEPAVGPPAGGQTVTITGTLLQGATSVKLGGASAAIVANTATSIVVTSPPHAVGSADVAVTTALGTVTLQDAYVYDTPPVIQKQTFLPPDAVVRVAAALNMSVDFSDAPGGAHTARWDWGDGTSSDGTVTEPQANAAGHVTGNHAWAATGIYIVSVRVADQWNSDTATYRYVVVHDPDGGFVTGGGWIDSPPGAYSADASLSGKATFALDAKYLKGALQPAGQNEFHFQAASLRFNSTACEWLVVRGARAQYRGSGTVNGSGPFAFLLDVSDGQLSGGADGLRIKIWNKATGQIVYDNLPGAPDDLTSEPQPIGGGSIVIHK